MKETGIIRRVDDLGRIVIPKPIREKMNIDYNNAMEVLIDEENGYITFKRYETREEKVEKYARKILDEIDNIDKEQMRVIFHNVSRVKFCVVQKITYTNLDFDTVNVGSCDEDYNDDIKKAIAYTIAMGYDLPDFI